MSTGSASGNPEAPEYASSTYWDRRYEDLQGQETYEWYLEYGRCRDFLRNLFELESRILMVGCGNSTLSEDMYDDGFKTITSFDISQSVINLMNTRKRQRYGDKGGEGLAYLCADGTDLVRHFPAAPCFEGAIDKGRPDPPS